MTILEWRTTPELQDAANVEKVDVDVFVGQEVGKLEFAGRLRLRVGEWQIIGAALLLGADATRGHLRIPSKDSGMGKLEI
jgi:hypothetical protein